MADLFQLNSTCLSELDRQGQLEFVLRVSTCPLNTVDCLLNRLDKSAERKGL